MVKCGLYRGPGDARVLSPAHLLSPGPHRLTRKTGDRNQVPCLGGGSGQEMHPSGDPLPSSRPEGWGKAVAAGGYGFQGDVLGGAGHEWTAALRGRRGAELVTGPQTLDRLSQEGTGW